MQYAVIKASGKQHKVTEGDILTLDKLDFGGKKTIVFDEVLLLADDKDVKVGKPNIAGASVEASLVEDKKGDKVRVSKFRAKSRYRKTIGFRPQQTVVKIEKIKTGGAKVAKKTEEATKTAPKSKNK